MRKALTILILTVNIILHAASDVALRLVTPTYQFEPAFARLIATVEPNPRNREYCLIYDGPNSGSQCRQMDGKTDSRTQPWLELKDLPEGHYVAQVRVQRNDGSVISSQVVEWDVVGPDYSPNKEP